MTMLEYNTDTTLPADMHEPSASCLSERLILRPRREPSTTFPYLSKNKHHCDHMHEYRSHLSVCMSFDLDTELFFWVDGTWVLFAGERRSLKNITDETIRASYFGVRKSVLERHFLFVLPDGSIGCDGAYYLPPKDFMRSSELISEQRHP